MLGEWYSDKFEETTRDGRMMSGGYSLSSVTVVSHDEPLDYASWIQDFADRMVL